MINWHKALKLYFIAGTQDIINNESLVDVLQEAIDYGVTCFQYREKGINSLQYREDRLVMARKLQLICQNANIPFIINDDVNMAIELKVDAVHVGQSDQPIELTLAEVKPLGIDVGLSINTLKELSLASKISSLDYVGIGPIFPTHSKDDAEPAIGIDSLQEYIDQYSYFPKVAIGGINIVNARSVLRTGVDGIAVISAITQSPNREGDIGSLLNNRYNPCSRSNY